MATKKTPARKTTRKPVARDALDLRPIKEKMTRIEMLDRIAEETELTRKQVSAVMTSLGDIIKASVMPKSIGVVQIPGILQIKARKIPAKPIKAIKKGTLVKNVFTGETNPHPGRPASVKPATRKVKALPMAQLKRAVLGTQ